MDQQSEQTTHNHPQSNLPTQQNNSRPIISLNINNKYDVPQDQQNQSMIIPKNPQSRKMQKPKGQELCNELEIIHISVDNQGSQNHQEMVSEITDDFDFKRLLRLSTHSRDKLRKIQQISLLDIEESVKVQLKQMIKSQRDKIDQLKNLNIGMRSKCFDSELVMNTIQHLFNAICEKDSEGQQIAVLNHRIQDLETQIQHLQLELQKQAPSHDNNQFEATVKKLDLKSNGNEIIQQLKTILDTKKKPTTLKILYNLLRKVINITNTDSVIELEEQVQLQKLEKENLKEQINIYKQKQIPQFPEQYLASFPEQYLTSLVSSREINKLQKLLQSLQAQWQQKFKNLQKQKSEIIAQQNISDLSDELIKQKNDATLFMEQGFQTSSIMLYDWVKEKELYSKLSQKEKKGMTNKLEQELNSLSDKLKRKQEIIDILEEQSSILRRRITDFENKRVLLQEGSPNINQAGYQQRIAELEAQLDTKKQQYQLILSKLASIQQQTAHKHITKQGQQKSNNNQNQLLFFLEKTRDEIFLLHRQVEDTQKKLDRLKVELREANIRVDELQVVKAENRRQIERLTQQLEEKNVELQKRKNEQNKNLQSQQNSLKNEINSLKAQIVDSRTAEEKIAAQFRELHNKYSITVKDLDHLKKLLKVKESDTQELIHQYQSISNQQQYKKSEFEKDLKSKKNELDALKYEYWAQQQEIQLKDRQIRQLEDSLKRNRDKYFRQMESSQGQFKSLIQELHKQIQSQNQNQIKNEVSEKSLRIINQQLETKQSELYKTKGQLSSVLQQNYVLKYKLQQLKSREFLEGTIKDLKRELQKKQNQISDSRNKTQALFLELHDLKAHLQFEKEHIFQNLQSAKRQLSLKQQQIQQMEHIISKYEQNCRCLVDELNRLKAQPKKQVVIEKLKHENTKNKKMIQSMKKTMQFLERELNSQRMQLKESQNLENEAIFLKRIIEKKDREEEHKKIEKDKLLGYISELESQLDQYKEKPLLQDTITQLNTQILIYKQRIQEYSQKLQDLQQKDQSMDKTLKHNERQIMELRQAIKGKDSSLAQLMKVNDEYQKTQKITETNSRNMKKQIQHKDQTICSMRERIDSLGEELMQKKLLLQESKEQVDLRDQQIRSLRGKLKNSQTTINYEKQRMQQIQRELVTKADQLKDNNKQISKFKQLVTELSHKLQLNQEKLESADKIINGLRMSQIGLCKNIQQLQSLQIVSANKIDTMKAELVKTRNQIKEKEQQICKYHQNVNQLKQENNQQKTYINTLEREKEQLKTQKVKLQNQVISQKERAQGYRIKTDKQKQLNNIKYEELQCTLIQLKTLQSQNKDLINKESELKYQIDIVRNKYGETKGSLQKVHCLNKKINSEKMDIQSQLKQSQEQIIKLKAELDQLRGSIKSLISQLQSSQEKIQELQTVKQKLLREIENHKRNNQFLQEELHIFRISCVNQENMEQKLMILQKDILRKEKQNTHIAQQLTEALFTIKTLSDSINSLQNTEQLANEFKRLNRDKDQNIKEMERLIKTKQEENKKMRDKEELMVNEYQTKIQESVKQKQRSYIQIQNLHKDLSKQNEQVRQLQKSLQSLTQSIEHKENQIVRLKQINGHQIKATDHARTQFMKIEGENQRLCSELIQLRQQVQKLQDSKCLLGSSLNELKVQIKNKELENNVLMGEKQRLERLSAENKRSNKNLIDNLQNELEKEKEKHKDMWKQNRKFLQLDRQKEIENQQYTSKLKVQASKIQELEVEILHLLQEASQFKELQGQIKSSINQLLKEINNIASILNEEGDGKINLYDHIDIDRDIIIRQIHQKIDEIKIMVKNRVEEEKNKKNEVQNQLKRQRQSVTGGKQLIEALEATNNQRQKQIKQLEEKLRLNKVQYKIEVFQLKTTIQSLKQHISDIQGSYQANREANADQTLNSILGQLQNQKQEFDNLTIQTAQYKQRITLLQSDLQKTQHDNQLLMIQGVSKEKHILSLNLLIEDLQHKIAEDQSQLYDIQKREDLQGKVVNLQRELRHANKIYESQKKTNGLLQQQLSRERMKQKYESHQTQIQILNKHLQSKNRQIISLKKMIEEIQTELEQVREKLINEDPTEEIYQLKNELGHMNKLLELQKKNRMLVIDELERERRSNKYDQHSEKLNGAEFSKQNQQIIRLHKTIRAMTAELKSQQQLLEQLKIDKQALTSGAQSQNQKVCDVSQKKSPANQKQAYMTDKQDEQEKVEVQKLIKGKDIEIEILKNRLNSFSTIFSNLSDKDREIQRLREKLSENQSSQELEKKNLQIDQLMSRLKKYECGIILRQKEESMWSQQSQSDIHHNQQKNSKLEKQVEHLKGLNSKLETQLEMVTNQRTQSLILATQNPSKCLITKQSLSHSQQKIQGLISTISHIRERTCKMQQTYQQKLNEAQKAKQELSHHVWQLEGQISELKKEIIEKGNKISQLSVVMKNQSSALDRESQEKDGVIESLKEQINTLKHIVGNSNSHIVNGYPRSSIKHPVSPQSDHQPSKMISKLANKQQQYNKEEQQELSEYDEAELQILKRINLQVTHLVQYNQKLQVKINELEENNQEIVKENALNIYMKHHQVFENYNNYLCDHQYLQNSNILCEWLLDGTKLIAQGHHQQYLDQLQIYLQKSVQAINIRSRSEL